MKASTDHACIGPPWLVKTRRAPSRHCRDARGCDHTTTVMHDNDYTPPCPRPLQVRTKAQRLSEWENMTDKQKTAVTELEKLKKALTMQARKSSKYSSCRDKGRARGYSYSCRYVVCVGSQQSVGRPLQPFHR